MANRLFNQFKGSLEKQVVHLYAQVTFATGVPTLVAGKCKGFKSVVKNGTGDYIFTFGDSATGKTDIYTRVLTHDVQWVTNSATTGPTTTASWAKAYGTSTVEIIFGTNRTTAADPNDADTLILTVDLVNSNAP